MDDDDDELNRTRVTKYETYKITKVSAIYLKFYAKSTLSFLC